jgi:hypothetical protein
MSNYLGSVGSSVIWLVRLDDGDDTVWVDWDGGNTDTVAWVHDKLHQKSHYVGEADC